MLPEIRHLILKKEVLFAHPEFQNYNKKRLSSACLDNLAMDLQETGGDY